MSHTTFEQTTTVYECCNKTNIHRQQTTHPSFSAFSHLFFKFNHLLGEHRLEEYWRTFIRPLKRYHFLVCTTPLPFNDGSLIAQDTYRSLKEHLRHCVHQYPQHADPAEKVLEAFAEVIGCPDPSPNFTAIQEGIDNCPLGASIGLVLREPSMTLSVENYLCNHLVIDTRFVDVVVPDSLRDTTYYDRLIVIGASRWFPRYVFSAPRSNEVLIICYQWIRDRWQPRAAFAGGRDSRLPRERESHDQNRDQQRIALDPTHVVPTLELADLNPYMDHSMAATTHAADEVDARPYVLEGDWFVFLDAAPDAQTDTIALTRDGRGQVTRIANKELSIGDYIVLRTSGSGDHIIQVADRIFLKERAGSLRKMQREWKSRLRDQVKRVGMRQVIEDLRNLGSTRAEPNNLRNWMSERNIRTDNVQDFQAIMRLVGLDDDDHTYWRAAETIDQAHRKAGMHIRELLLRIVEEEDLESLRLTGRMDFSLPGVDGGTLSAFRIKQTLSDTVEMPHSQLRHANRMDR